MTLEQFAANRGQPLLAGTSPIVLEEPGYCWLLQAGFAELFTVPVVEGQERLRTHLLTLGPGDLVFALQMPPFHEGLHFLLLPQTGTQVCKLPLSEILSCTDPQVRADLAQKIDHCIAALHESLLPALPPKDFAALASCGESSLDPALPAKAGSGVAWVAPRNAPVKFVGKLDLTQEYVPVTPEGWIQSSASLPISVLATSELLQRQTLPRALAECAAIINRWVLLNHQHAGEAERVRLAKKAKLGERSIQTSASQLISIFEDHHASIPDLPPGGDPLAEVCRALASRLGVKTPSAVAIPAGMAHNEAVSLFAAASRLRARKVLLAGAWWEEDNGPLLAFVEDRPVALLPASSSRYEIYDPAKPARVPLSREMADLVSPSAFMFYRPFPDRALRVMDLVRFGLAGNARDLAMVGLIGMAGGALTMLTPIATGLIMDSIIPSGQRSELWQISLGLFLLAVTGLLFGITRDVALLRAETRSNTSMQAAVWDRLLRLPMPFFKRFSAGDLALRANGVNEIRARLSTVVLSTVLSGIFSIFNFGLLFFYSPLLAMLATGLVLLSVFCTAAATYFSVRFARSRFELQGKIAGLVLQFVTGVSKLRVAGAEAQAYSLWARRFSQEKEFHMKTAKISNALKVFSTVFPTVTAIALFATIAFPLGGKISTGSFLAFNAAWGSFLGAMLGMASAILGSLEIIPLFERAKPILETVPEVDGSKLDPGPLSGAVEISHLRFRYKEGGPLILNDVSVRIEPGQFVALVGPSGSGKSTLLRLLLGFEFAESGTIYYDGMDLATLDVQALRKRFGVVLQNGSLMPGSIYENIAGISAITMDEAWDAARKSGLEEDIEAMPMGLHTVISEGASTLSGGQRQRLMIARAIVHKPRLILFDEATSALDNRTQAIVSRSLEQLQATRIVIAHRLSTIIKADRIFVLQNGKLVQEGTYETLVKKPGLFAELAKRQLA